MIDLTKVQNSGLTDILAGCTESIDEAIADMRKDFNL